MTYYIAKSVPGFEDSKLVVRSIRRGGLSIDNYRWFPLDRAPVHQFARQFATLSAAESALNKMHTIGGFFDYQIQEITK